VLKNVAVRNGVVLAVVVAGAVEVATIGRETCRHNDRGAVDPAALRTVLQALVHLAPNVDHLQELLVLTLLCSPNLKRMSLDEKSATTHHNHPHHQHQL
jgi:hypothetical protein